MSSDQNRIFISIASYRDPQLIPTIRSCIAQAANPDDLRFGICWQHDDAETDFPYAGDSRFRLLDVPSTHSRGACWARAQIMKEWRGEEWFLQLDSHCRMAPHWDAQLIRWMVERNAGRRGTGVTLFGGISFTQAPKYSPCGGGPRIVPRIEWPLISQNGWGRVQRQTLPRETVGEGFAGVPGGIVPPA